MTTKTKPTQRRYRTAEIVESRQLDDGSHEITIAANNVARDNIDLDLSTLRLDNYRRNPVVLWSHDRLMPPIGRTTEIVRDDDNRLRARFEFASEDQFAARIENLWNQGIIRAASISWGGGDISFPDSGPLVRETNAELFEWSLVAVGADPDALRGVAEELGMSARDLVGAREGTVVTVDEEAIRPIREALSTLSHRVDDLEAKAEAPTESTENDDPEEDGEQLAEVAEQIAAMEAAIKEKE